MRAIGVTMVLVLSACSGSNDKASTAAGTEVSNSASTDDVGTATESGEAALERLLGEANTAVYAAQSDEGVDAAFAELSRTLADTPAITMAMLDAEIEKRNGHITSLHSGEERVYPDQRTMRWMMGVVDALEAAKSQRSSPE